MTKMSLLLSLTHTPTTNTSAASWQWQIDDFVSATANMAAGSDHATAIGDMKSDQSWMIGGVLYGIAIVCVMLMLFFCTTQAKEPQLLAAATHPLQQDNDIFVNHVDAEGNVVSTARISAVSQSRFLLSASDALSAAPTLLQHPASCTSSPKKEAA
eukprot:TRINITY_DN90395_c0_g1_i1.p1 TRINITY_DN90395_c0_g1~~TRINITY_DN90395_c0_g1_i1.p1  ORF type:complete len:171 (+),score=31.25 TRINITY_DN90395_c0_g1_i1:48-515(+)